tara:strand:+ start:6278 stop:6463 length:186 start_codon:yes stop_codon:yes gene_type:complete
MYFIITIPTIKSIIENYIGDLINSYFEIEPITNKKEEFEPISYYRKNNNNDDDEFIKIIIV